MTRDLKSSRSPEREKLAEAIERRASAAQALARADAAYNRLGDELFDRLGPQLAQAEERLEEAREGEPEAVVAATLGETPPGPSVAEIEAEIASINAKMSEVRKARQVLFDERRRADETLRVATHHVELAIVEVSRNSPAAAALKGEFFRSGERMLRLAKYLRSAGWRMDGVEGLGLHARIVDIVEASGASTFRDDLQWIAAREALQNDPDAPLPLLPQAEDGPEETKSNDRTAVAA